MAAVARRHSMPFGAELGDDDDVRFRLWAPAANGVDLCLLHGSGIDAADPECVPMTCAGDGWFSYVSESATSGTRYWFRIDGGMRVPDPASRRQPDDVHGPSEVVDPGTYHWSDSGWRGRPWHEAVLYELHVGTFTPAGTFVGVRERLDYLADLGITAIELMPVAAFPGARNWGYDGVYLFAPDSRYGIPDEFKALVDAAHARGLMVFLDVVYNHFGPEGNYLHLYAPQFFRADRHTPWGAAINLDGDHGRWVREFFIHNALYWLEEFHLDGLRLDAVDTLIDNSERHLLNELAARVRTEFTHRRHVHLVLENDDNAARYLASDATDRGQRFDAQWNDDFHHALHATLTGEDGGYYQDYADQPVRHLARCLVEGFAYQGEPSAYRGNARRGEPSIGVPATAFVTFLQNHDQVGNRVRSDRVVGLCAHAALRAATALLLLAPSPPLLFMGQEWGCTTPFYFFCDFEPGLAVKVGAGRRSAFSRFPDFRDPQAAELIPDVSAAETFHASMLDWAVHDEPGHREWLNLHRELLAIRSDKLMPRLGNLAGMAKSYEMLSDRAFTAHWVLGDRSTLPLAANLSDQPVPTKTLPTSPVLYSTHADIWHLGDRTLPPWSVTWWLGCDDDE